LKMRAVMMCVSYDLPDKKEECARKSICLGVTTQLVSRPHLTQAVAKNGG
jgi:hypothetical protein